MGFFSFSSIPLLHSHSPPSTITTSKNSRKHRSSPPPPPLMSQSHSHSPPRSPRRTRSFLFSQSGIATTCILPFVLAFVLFVCSVHVLAPLVHRSPTPLFVWHHHILSKHNHNNHNRIPSLISPSSSSSSAIDKNDHDMIKMMTKHDPQQQQRINKLHSSTSSQSLHKQTTASSRFQTMPPNHCILTKPTHSITRQFPPHLSPSSSSSSSSFFASSPSANFNPLLNISLIHHFNARMFCFHSHLCLSRRTSLSPSTQYQPIVALHAQPTCRRATPSLVDVDESVSTGQKCENLEAINNCAFALQHLKQMSSCPKRMALNNTMTAMSDDDLEGDGVRGVMRQYWMSGQDSDDEDEDDSHSSRISSGSKRSGSSRVEMDDDDDEHVTVVVPAYICLNNIYHYVHVIAHVTQVVASINSLLPLWKSGHSPPLPSSSSSSSSSSSVPGVKRVTLLFRGDLPSGYGGWQHSITDLFIEHRFKSGLGLQSVTVKSLFEDEFQPWFTNSPSRHLSSFLTLQQQPNQLICSKNTIMIGFRQSNAWPFANAYDFPTNGTISPSSKKQKNRLSVKNIVDGHDRNDHSNLTGVPAEAITFRATVYKGLNLTTVMNVSKILSASLSNPPNTLLLDLPPLTLGYARRNSRPDPPPGEFIIGRARRFSDADEHWFTSMLSTVIQRHNFPPLIIVQPKADTPFSGQVAAYKDVGVMVGIHGANLVNVLFMHAFTGLVELANDWTKCYIRGGNAGLNYWHFIPNRIASVKESFCGPRNVKCLNHVRNRRIFMERMEDRKEVESIVEAAVGRIVRFRKMFEHLGGVPVVYKRDIAEYVIDWSLARKEEDDVI